MSAFVLNIVLALAWMAVSGVFSPTNLLLGFVAGFVVVAIAGPVIGNRTYPGRMVRIVRFVLFVGWELLLANLRVAYDIITPRHRMSPGIVAVPLDVTTDGQLTLLANLITLTPDSLSLDVSEDRRTLFVHSMYVGQPDTFRRQIKQGLERRVMELLT